MGLTLSHDPGNTGNSGDYWKILKLNIDFHNESYEVILGLFNSSSDRAAGKNIIGAVSKTYSGDDFTLDATTLDVASANVYKEAYAKIKAEDDLEGIDFTAAVDN